MKKIVSATIAAMVMTVGASAEESFFDYKQEIGVGATVFESYAGAFKTSYGVNINGKLMKTVSENFAVGITLNMDYNPSVNLNTTSQQPKEYLIDILPTVTYIVNKEVDVSAMFGYEFGKYDAPWTEKFDTEGYTFGISTSYAINEHVRVNLQALRTKLDFSNSGYTSADYYRNRYTIGVGYNF